MKERRAQLMLEKAREYVGDELPTAPKFDDVNLERFLRLYLWVIYVSGFRASTVERHRAALEAAFHNLNLNVVAAMDSINARNLPIQNQRKADCFRLGCKLIRNEGWRRFKRRVKQNYPTVLQELPGIGPVTWRQMAMFLGLEDTEKCDVWMRKCARECATTVPELVSFLGQKYGLTRLQVDYCLWRYCSDNQELP